MQPAPGNNGFQTIPWPATREVPREVDRFLHTDFKPSLPVLRFPLQPCTSFFKVGRQPATCGGNSSIEGVQQNQPTSNDRSSPDRQEDLQALLKTFRQGCLVHCVLNFGDQEWASLRRGPIIGPRKCAFP